MVYYSSYRSEDEPPQGHQFFLVECDLFLKSPITMKGCLIMVYIQEHADRIIIFLCSGKSKITEAKENHIHEHKFCNHVDKFWTYPKNLRKAFFGMSNNSTLYSKQRGS